MKMAILSQRSGTGEPHYFMEVMRAILAFWGTPRSWYKEDGNRLILFDREIPSGEYIFIEEEESIETEARDYKRLADRIFEIFGIKDAVNIEIVDFEPKPPPTEFEP